MRARAAVLARCAGAVALRPRLWRTTLRQVRRTAPTGWWRRPPFLPVPPAEYLRFRLVTQYGTADRAVDAADVLDYLSWCRRQP